MINLFVKAHQFFFANLQKFIAKEVMRFRVQEKEESTHSDFTAVESDFTQLETERNMIR